MTDRRSRRRAPLLAAAAALALVLSGCGGSGDGGEGSAGEAGAGGTGVLCVDAQGPNSQSVEILRATLDTPLHNPVTDTWSTQKQALRDGVGIAGGVVGGDGEDPTAILDNEDELARDIFAAVPDGGDAAFAAEVCGLADAWDEFGYAGENTEVLWRTPHLLRGVGRGICGSIVDGQSAEEAFASRQEERDLIASDPLPQIQQAIEQFEDAVKGVDPATATEFDQQLQGAAKLALERFRDYEADPQLLVQALDNQLAVMWAAVEHQCPDKR